MIASCLNKDLSAFWSPNFDRKPSDNNATSPVTQPVQKKPRKNSTHCRTMQALQRSLSEAQKIGVGVDILKELIKKHKANCTNCHPTG